MQRETITAAHRARGGRADIAAAVLLGRPGGAGFGVPVHANYVMQETVADVGRGVRCKHVGYGAGERDGTIQADVGLGEDVAHREGEEVRRTFRVRQADDAAAIELAMLLLVPGVGDDAIDDLTVAIVGFERGRRVTVGVVGLCLDLGQYPVMKIGKLARVGGQARCACREVGLEIGIETNRAGHLLCNWLDALRRASCYTTISAGCSKRHSPGSLSKRKPS